MADHWLPVLSGGNLASLPDLDVTTGNISDTQILGAVSRLAYK